jgi:hypothetical protein
MMKVVKLITLHKYKNSKFLYYLHKKLDNVRTPTPEFIRKIQL